MKKFTSYIRHLSEGTAKPEELEVKKYILALLSPLGIKVSGGSKIGTPWHVRAAVGLDPKSFFKQFKEIKIKPAKESASSQYDTFEISVKDVGNALFVNQTRAADDSKVVSLTPKQLAPDMFHLGGQELSPSEIKSFVKKSIKGMNKLDKNTKKFLVDLLDKADNKGTPIDISDILPPDEVSKRDLATISKDYGEILAGVWACRNIGFKKVFFPLAINEPLADFYGIRGRIRYPVSVKSGGGSATSVKNLVEILEEHMKDPEYIKGFSKTQVILLDVMFKLRDLTAMEGIVYANVALKTDGAKELAKAMGIQVNAITLQRIQDWLISFKTNKQIKAKLAPMHKKMGKGVDDKTWGRLKGKGLIGFAIGPMGHHVVQVLTKKYKKELTEMVRQIILVQLNVDVKKNTLNAKYDKFKDLKFKFAWQGGAPNPNRNKLGFQVGK